MSMINTSLRLILFTLTSARFPLYGFLSHEIKANNASPENKYIQSARLNGKELNQAWFNHSDIIDGGLLEVEMGPKANKSWGTATPPPSAAPMP